MGLKEKINLPLLIGSHLLISIVLVFLAKNRLELIVFFSILIATLLNQYLLARGVEKMFNASKENEKATGMTLVFFLSKFIILFAAMGLGVHFIGNRIIVPILVYIAQLFILLFSLKKG